MAKEMMNARVKILAVGLAFALLCTLGCSSSLSLHPQKDPPPSAERKIASVQSSQRLMESQLVEKLNFGISSGMFDGAWVRENIEVYSTWLREFFRISKTRGNAKEVKRQLLGLLWNARISLHKQREFIDADYQGMIAETLTDIERAVRKGSFDGAVAVAGKISDSIDWIRSGLRFF